MHRWHARGMAWASRPANAETPRRNDRPILIQTFAGVSLALEPQGQGHCPKRPGRSRPTSDATCIFGHSTTQFISGNTPEDNSETTTVRHPPPPRPASRRDAAREVSGGWLQPSAPTPGVRPFDKQRTSAFRQAVWALALLAAALARARQNRRWPVQSTSDTGASPRRPRMRKEMSVFPFRAGVKLSSTLLSAIAHRLSTPLRHVNAPIYGLLNCSMVGSLVRCEAQNPCNQPS